MREPIVNYSGRKVGGIWFFKLGIFRLSFCMARRRFEDEARYRRPVVANADR